jgi:hypothetical protein
MIKVRNTKSKEVFWAKKKDILDSSDKIKCFDEPFLGKGCHDFSTENIQIIMCTGNRKDPKHRKFLKDVLEVCKEEDDA